MRRPADPPPGPREAGRLKSIERFARGMHLAATVFLAFWMLIAGAMVVISACALLGVPAGARFRGTPAHWAGVMAGGIAACGVGPVFVRFWRRRLDLLLERVRSADVSGGQR